MPTLTELEASLIRYNEIGFSEINELSEAQGILFLCPLCFINNNGAIGTHSVLISFANRGVTDEQGSKNSSGQPSRWNIIGGTGLNDLQLSPSINLDISDCKWHGFIGNSGVHAGHAN